MPSADAKFVAELEGLAVRYELNRRLFTLQSQRGANLPWLKHYINLVKRFREAADNMPGDVRVLIDDQLLRIDGVAAIYKFRGLNETLMSIEIAAENALKNKQHAKTQVPKFPCETEAAGELLALFVRRNLPTAHTHIAVDMPPLVVCLGVVLEAGGFSSEREDRYRGLGEFLAIAKNQTDISP